METRSETRNGIRRSLVTTLMTGAAASVGIGTLVLACSGNGSSSGGSSGDPTPPGTTILDTTGPSSAPYQACEPLQPGTFVTSSGGSFAIPATKTFSPVGAPASGPADTHCQGQAPQTVNGQDCSLDDAGPPPGDDAGTTTIDAGDGGVIVAANPNITAIGTGSTPASATPSVDVGSGATNITVNGTGFVSGAVVSFNGTNLTTTFTSATALGATVPATMLATSGVPSVVVTNPDGAASAPLTFYVAGPCDEFGPDGAYGGTHFNDEGADDDCKYQVSYTASPLCENNGTYFVVTANYLSRTLADGGLAPLTGASTFAEVCLSSSHPGPAIDGRPNGGDQQVVEGPPGTYTVGPVQFDAPGMWTVRFHFDEFCCDVAADSPHGHAAFFVNVP